VGQGVKEVVVAKEETRDVLVPEDQYLLGFFVYFVNISSSLMPLSFSLSILSIMVIPE
jgi:hypothetical protein